MALNRIFLWLGNSFVLIATMMLMTSFMAVMFEEYSEAAIFGGLALLVGLVGVIFSGMTWHTPGRESNTEALAFLLIFWMVMPVILCVPYLVLGEVPHVYYGYFEAVSAVTTTGASTLDADAIPRALHIWRSFLQWMGGVITATFAVVVLAALNLQGTGVHRSILFTFKKGELFERLLGIGRVIAMIYAGISLLGFSILILSGTPVFEAFCLSLSSVSTGGLTPRSGVLAEYVNPFGALILGICCLLGAFNVAVVWDAFRLRNWRRIFGFFRDVEHRALFVICSALFLVAFAYTGPMHIVTILIETLYFASSTGFDYHVIGVEMVPPVILIAVALIGGSALSTAGGVKLIRILLLFRHLETDLGRLTHPSRVVPVRFKGQVLPDRAFLSIWMYFFGYTLVFALGILALSLFGMDYQIAVASSAASLANMGPLLDYTLPEYTYNAFTIPQLLISCLLMLVGRVEVLAALAIFSPGLWRS